LHVPAKSVEAFYLSDVTLAVLAGGVGRRMGIPKAKLRIGDQPILAWLLEHLQWPGKTMLVGSPAVSDAPAMHLFDQNVTDPVDGLGPVRGILSALEMCTTSLLCVIPVDMPYLTQPRLEWVLQVLAQRPAYLGVLCTVQRGSHQTIEPFPSAFRTSAAPHLRQYLDDGQRSIKGLLAMDIFRQIAVPSDWAENTWTNLNHPEELEAFNRCH
jgi:molybdopterin-guanine dinucleotide biosynthesis protein A